MNTGGDSFKAGFWADQDVPDKRQDFGGRKQCLVPWGVSRLGGSFIFQPGDGFIGRGWEAGTALMMAGAVVLKQTSKCGEDVCAVKHHG